MKRRLDYEGADGLRHPERDFCYMHTVGGGS